MGAPAVTRTVALWLLVAACTSDQSAAPTGIETPLTGPPVALAFIATPGSVVLSGLELPLVAIVAVDSAGVPVQKFRGIVEVTLTGAHSSTLSGLTILGASDTAIVRNDVRIAAAGGVAFTNLTINGLESGIALEARSTGLRSAQTQAFNVVSPGRIAFASPTSDNDLINSTGFFSHIYTLDVGSGTVTQLTTTDSVVDAEPAWSPDGSQIAFRRGGNITDASGNFVTTSIFVMHADGSGLRRLTTSGFATAPAWSPDGTRIAFIADGVLYVMNADGSGIKRLPSPVSNRFLFLHARWSPDGATIAIDGVSDATDEFALIRVYLMSADGSHIEPLTSDCSYFSPCGLVGEELNPAWSPDGKGIVFYSQLLGLTVIRRDAFDATKAPVRLEAFGMLLNSSVVSNAHPDFAPDGSHVVFCRPDSQIYTAVADGSRGLQKLINVPHGAFDPAWSRSKR